MTIEDHIADFLLRNNYIETLKALEKEYKKPFNTIVSEPLEDIVEDRYNFNKLKNVKTSNTTFIDDISMKKNFRIQNWMMPYPQEWTPVASFVKSLVVSMDVGFADGISFLFLSTADNTFSIVNLDLDRCVFSQKSLVNCVIKKVIVTSNSSLILVGMDGMVHTYSYLISENKAKLKPMNSVRANEKLIVEAKVLDGVLVTLGFDRVLRVFSLDREMSLIDEIKFQFPMSCMDVFTYSNKIHIAVGKVDNTLVDVFRLDSKLSLLHRVALNDASFYIADFYPRCIAIYAANDQTPLLAAVTSHEPESRLIVTPLFGPLNNNGSKERVLRNSTLVNISSSSMSDKFSQPSLAWKAENNSPSGIWMTNDDGSLCGYDLLTNKKAFNNKVHDGRIKSLCVKDNILVTSGIDKKIILWR